MLAPSPRPPVTLGEGTCAAGRGGRPRAGGLRATLGAGLLALVLAGCGLGRDDEPARTDGAPPATQQRDPEGTAAAPPPPAASAVAPSSFPAQATKNTTRVPGRDSSALAASVARVVFPARSRATRPAAVVLAPRQDWRAAISAAQLMAAPLRAPVLLTDGVRLGPETAAALRDLAPTGARAAGGAQVFRVGSAPRPAGYATVDLAGADPASLARAIDRAHGGAARRVSRAVVVAPADEPATAMPAAAWAAKSGDPVLWTSRDALPAATRRAIAEHRRPRIYVLGPPAAVSDAVVGELRRLGRVRRVAGDDPVTNAIAFARYDDGPFGWNVVDPGHGIVFAATARPADAAAAAPLSASGSYGPLLLLPAAATTLPRPVQDYLLDIQPGYESDPVRGVYNHGWLVGDESAVSVDVQSRIDLLLEIQPVDASRP